MLLKFKSTLTTWRYPVLFLIGVFAMGVLGCSDAGVPNSSPDEIEKAKYDPEKDKQGAGGSATPPE